MLVSGLHVFPVKSLRGAPASVARVRLEGLEHDRRWMVVDPEGRTLHAEKLPRMLAITALPLADGGITLSSPGQPALTVTPPVAGTRVAVLLARAGSALDAGAGAQDWLTAVLGRPARLVWLDDPSRRSVSTVHGGRPGEVLSLADVGPLLLTSMASLRRLDRWAEQDFADRYAQCGASAGTRPGPLAMERFRPNLVVDGDLDPFVEDGWQAVRIGDVRMRVLELCARCALPGTDPETQAVGREPLRTLARHRRWEQDTWFGVRLVPETTGTVRVGDAVVALPAARSTAVGVSP